MFKRNNEGTQQREITLVDSSSKVLIFLTVGDFKKALGIHRKGNLKVCWWQCGISFPSLLF